MAETTANLSTVLPLITPWLALCEPPAIQQTLQVVARRFCQDTGIWCMWLTTTLTANVDSYDFQALLDAEYLNCSIARILQVMQDETVFYQSGWQMDNAGLLVLVNGVGSLPTTPPDLSALCVVQPGLNCTVYPAWLLNEWAEVIAAGTLADLKRRTKVPFSDPEGAVEQGRIYQYGVGRAGVQWQTQRKANTDLKLQDMTLGSPTTLGEFHRA